MNLPRSIVLFVSFLALPLSLSVARAADAPAGAGAASCVITPADLDAIGAAQADGFAAELAARRALLARTIGCAKEEVQTLQDGLNSMDVADDDETLLTQLVNKLGDAGNYYDIELAKVNGAGIAGTKAIAREVYDWRQANYRPLAGQVADFTLWSTNQNLFLTAATRLTQTRNTVLFITRTAPQSDLQNAFANAEALVQAANEKNLEAKSALLRFLPPDESLALIQRSLQSLADAYKRFSDVNAIVQTLLPTDK